MTDLEQALRGLMARDAAIWRQRTAQLFAVGNSNKRSKPGVDGGLPAPVRFVSDKPCERCGAEHPERYVKGKQCCTCMVLKQRAVRRQRRQQRRQRCERRTKSKH